MAVNTGLAPEVRFIVSPNRPYKKRAEAEDRQIVKQPPPPPAWMVKPLKPLGKSK